MSDSAIRVPASVPGDPTDVSTALEVAGALWAKGSTDESLRWLKRAAEAATETGNAARADELGNAIVELETSLTAKVAPALVPSVAAASAASRPPPPPVSAASTAVRASAAPPAAASTTGRPPPPPLVRSSASVPPVSRAPARSVAPAPRAAMPVSAVTAVPIAVVPAAFTIPSGTPIRVSVRASARDPDLLVVRLLPAGRPLPPGTREASLVLVEEEGEEARNHTNGSAVS
jgi:Meckel syndrome type 1 protein